MSSTEELQAQAREHLRRMGQLSGFSRFFVALRKPASWIMLLLLALGLLGMRLDFVPAPLLRGPVAIAACLAFGAVLGTWLLRSFRTATKFDWKWAVWVFALSLFVWSALAKVGAWACTQATGAAYAQVFPMHYYEHHGNVRDNYYRNGQQRWFTRNGCHRRLGGEVMSGSLPNYLCLDDSKFDRIPADNATHEVLLRGKIGPLGRSIDGVEPAPTTASTTKNATR